MELFLNSAWAGLAVLSLFVWLRADHRSQRRLPFTAWIMFVVILFPVISVSDDLWSVQNPAETDTSLRRDHVASPAHLDLLHTAALPEAAHSHPAPATDCWLVPTERQGRNPHNCAFDSVENRPPPAI